MPLDKTNPKERTTASHMTLRPRRDSMALSPGTLFGPYKIRSVVGSGGMGEVYCAKDTRLGREVAIKVLSCEIAPSKDRLDRFKAEARAASALNHPNIVTIYELGQVDSIPYIAMELIDGQTLRELLSQTNPGTVLGTPWIYVSRTGERPAGRLPF